MRALESERPCVLLIDELDKVETPMKRSSSNPCRHIKSQSRNWAPRQQRASLLSLSPATKSGIWVIRFDGAACTFALNTRLQNVKPRS